MKQELRPVAAQMATIVQDPKASRFERVLAAQILLSLHGCLLPAVDERWLSVRQITQLRKLQRDAVEQWLHRKEVRRRQNRRYLLRKKIRAMEAQQQQGGTDENIAGTEIGTQGADA